MKTPSLVKRALDPVQSALLAATIGLGRETARAQDAPRGAQAAVLRRGLVRSLGGALGGALGGGLAHLGGGRALAQRGGGAALLGHGLVTLGSLTGNLLGIELAGRLHQRLHPSTTTAERAFQKREHARGPGRNTAIALASGLGGGILGGIGRALPGAALPLSTLGSYGATRAARKLLIDPYPNPDTGHTSAHEKSSFAQLCPLWDTLSPAHKALLAKQAFINGDQSPRLVDISRASDGALTSHIAGMDAVSRNRLRQRLRGYQAVGSQAAASRALGINAEAQRARLLAVLDKSAHTRLTLRAYSE